MKDQNGEYDFVTLDSLNIPEKIDLIKIDVEGHEIETLEGAKNTILKNKPIIVIETFNHRDKVEEILFSHGYKIVDVIREGEDYIFKYDETNSF